MLKKLLSLLFGKKELKAPPMPAPVHFISIHDDIKKTLEEMKEKQEVVTKVEAPKKEKKKTTKVEKAKDTKTSKVVKAVKAPEVKKPAPKKKDDMKMSAKKGPKKSK
jgi:hypothetical protein